MECPGSEKITVVDQLKRLLELKLVTNQKEILNYTYLFFPNHLTQFLSITIENNYPVQVISIELY